MEHTFANKVVVISGAARGIGEALVREFLRLGARVVALDRRWDESDPFFGELRQDDRALALSCDVTSDEDVAQSYVATMRRWGSVDVLINNAAMRQRDLYPGNGERQSATVRGQNWGWKMAYKKHHRPPCRVCAWACETLLPLA